MDQDEMHGVARGQPQAAERGRGEGEDVGVSGTRARARKDVAGSFTEADAVLAHRA